MMPLGVWLTYRATTDQGVFDLDSFFQRFKFLKRKKKDNTSFADAGIYLTQQEKALVLSRNENQLKEIVKNYKEFDYSEDVKKAAIKELKRKGTSEEELNSLQE